MIGLTLGPAELAADAEHRAPRGLAGTDASMAPGFETREDLEASKAAEDYWARV